MIRVSEGVEAAHQRGAIHRDFKPANILLLTGRYPYCLETDLQKMLATIRCVEQCPPRELDWTIPRDLEAVLLKTRGRERNHRYQSAKALAEDLSAVLGVRPVLGAQPQSAHLHLCRISPDTDGMRREGTAAGGSDHCHERGE